MSQEPQSKVKLLEDGDAALISGSTDPVEAGVEFADLSKLGESEKKPEDAAPAAAAPAAKPAAAAPAAPDEELPTELKGKTPAQLAKMLKDAQSLIGRQGSELGDLRQRVDFAIQTSLAAVKARGEKPAEPAPAAKPEPVLDETEFFAKPLEAISKAIENHPLIKKIEQTLGKSAADAETTRATRSTERFNAAHPDAQEILGKPEFRQWVAASPIRRALMARAHNQFDFDAGDEVFSTWKALQGIGVRSAPAAGDTGTVAAPAAAAAAPAADAVSEAARTLAAARTAKAAAAAQTAAAVVPTGGTSAAGTGGTKKVFRRADVLHLMETDPARYEQLADEIALAYAEGRVR